MQFARHQRQLVILKAETLKHWAVTAFCGWERKSVGTPRRRLCLRWLAEWDSEIAVVVEEKERNLWAEMPTNSSPPEMSTRLTRLVVDKTSRRTALHEGQPVQPRADSSSLGGLVVGAR